MVEVDARKGQYVTFINYTIVKNYITVSIYYILFIEQTKSMKTYNLIIRI